MNRKKVIIEGMSCAHCVNHVKEGLAELPQAKSVTVNLDDKSAILEYDGVMDDKEIKEVIDDLGYDVISIDDFV